MAKLREAGSARLCRPEAYTTSLAIFLIWRGPDASRTVELALDLAGWKPALLSGSILHDRAYSPDWLARDEPISEFLYL